MRFITALSARLTCPKPNARPIRHNAQVPDRNGKIFYTSIASLSHISKVRWDKTRIEEVVLEALKAQIAMMTVQSRGKSKAVQSKGTMLRQKLKILTGELKSGDSQKVQSYLDYREGRITREDFIALRAQREQRAGELQEEIARTEAEYQEYLDAEEQAKKERAIARKTGSLDEESLREIMYDAVERVNFVDGQNIEIVWKFDDLFRTA